MVGKQYYLTLQQEVMMTTHLHTHTHAYTHIHRHTHTQTYTHTYTHTQTHKIILNLIILTLYQLQQPQVYGRQAILPYIATGSYDHTPPQRQEIRMIYNTL